MAKNDNSSSAGGFRTPREQQEESRRIAERAQNHINEEHGGDNGDGSFCSDIHKSMRNAAAYDYMTKEVAKRN